MVSKHGVPSKAGRRTRAMAVTVVTSGALLVGAVGLASTAAAQCTTSGSAAGSTCANVVTEQVLAEKKAAFTQAADAAVFAADGLFYIQGKIPWVAAQEQKWRAAQGGALTPQQQKTVDDVKIALRAKEHEHAPPLGRGRCCGQRLSGGLERVPRGQGQGLSGRQGGSGEGGAGEGRAGRGQEEGLRRGQGGVGRGGAEAE